MTVHAAGGGDLSSSSHDGNLRPWEGRGQAQPNGLVWRSRDEYRLVTGVALLGFVTAVALVVFGLPAVDFHPPLHYLGIMDPLCGGTRAARFTASGDFAQAWRYNPLGIAAVLGAVVVLLRAAIGLTTGRWLTVVVTFSSRQRRVLMVVIVVLFVVLEIRQQGRADLLIAR